MKIKLLSTCALLASGCANITPNLNMEGANLEVGVVSSSDANFSLTRINLARELDPLGYGEQEFYARTAQNECRNSASSTAQRFCNKPDSLALAFEGFYSPKYFENLSDLDKASYNVTNISSNYAERQARELKRLAEEVSKDIEEEYFSENSFTGLRTFISEDLFEMRKNDIKDRISAAQTQAPYLEYQRQRRNRMQMRVITSSDKACDEYKRSLNSLFSDSNFAFGSSSTIAGGLGAIFTDTDTVRALAGTAGVLSGVRAEFNDSYFRSEVVEVLTKAIDIARDKKLDEIERRRRLLLIDYTAQDAVRDAIEYNARCTLIMGLQETSDALTTVSDPGLIWLANVYGGADYDANRAETLFNALGSAVSSVQKMKQAAEDANTVIGAASDENVDNAPSNNAGDTPSTP